MTAAAAVHGMGLALVPRLLVGDELTRGDLVVACVQPLTGARAYYLVLPEGDDNPPVTQLFKDWLLEVLHTEAAG
jgi:LysR family glycine cleavage system transcriptional activator